MQEIFDSYGITVTVTPDGHTKDPFNEGSCDYWAKYIVEFKRDEDVFSMVLFDRDNMEKWEVIEHALKSCMIGRYFDSFEEFSRELGIDNPETYEKFMEQQTGLESILDDAIDELLEVL